MFDRQPVAPLIASLVVSLASASIAHAANLYVATTVNVANSGATTETAWRHIQTAASRARAGDTVYVLGGVYNETVAINASGSAAAGPITFENYPGQTPIVDGTGLSIPGGQFGLFTLVNRSWVVISGFELRNYKTTKINLVPVGIYVTGAGGHIQLLDNHIHNIETTAAGCKANALGMAIYGSSAPASLNNLTISGNEIDHLKTGCSETMSLDGNVDGFLVTNNLIHDNNNIGIDAIGFETVAPDPAYDQARNGRITLNVVYNISSQNNPSYPPNCWCSDGIYVDGGTNIVIDRNLVHHVDIGIEMASEHLNHVTSYITARNNLIYFGNSAGFSIGGYAKTVGGSDHITMVGNTLLGNDRQNTDSGEFQIQWRATNNLFENNIVEAGKQGLVVNDRTASSPDPVTLGYNLYDAPDKAAASSWVWQHKLITGYAAFLAAAGDETGSLFANPRFVSASKPELMLSASSPAIHAGDNLGPAVVGPLDFAGAPRVQGSTIDIGAYEY